MENLPPSVAETADQTAKRLTNETIMLAVANTRSLLQDITMRGLDPNARFSEVRDALDVNLRIAAPYFDQKKAAGPATPQFQLKINLPNTPGYGGGQTITIEAGTGDPASQEDTLDALPLEKPAYLDAIIPVSNLAPAPITSEDADE